MIEFIKKNRNLIIIALFPFVLYGNIIFNEYNLDDNFVIENNIQIQKGISGIPEIFKTRYSNRDGLSYEYRPLTKSYFAILYSLFGDSPHLFHFLSIILFSILSLLIYKLFRELFKNISEEILLIAVMLFISYPANTEVVSSLKNNEQLFSTIFSVISFIFLLKYFDINKIKYLFVAAISIFIALLAKLDAIIFLPIMFIGIIYFRKLSIKKVLTSTVILVIFFSFYKLLKSGLPKPNRILSYVENPLYFNHDLSVRISTGLTVISQYLAKLFYPFNLKFYYGFKEFQLHYFNEPIVWGALLFLLILVAVTVYFYKKDKTISFLLFVFIISAIAFSNIYKSVAGVFADRFLFIPSIFAALLIGYLLFKTRKKKSLYYIIISVLLVILSIKTISRNTDWKNRETLYTADINKLYETSAKANEVYASMLLGKISKDKSNKENTDNLKLAEKHFKKCIEIYPEKFSSLNNLGLIYFMYYKDYDKALKYFEKANSLNPNTNDIKVLYNIGMINQIQKRYNIAEENYIKILEKDSSVVNVYYNLADIYFEKRDLERAIDMNLRAHKITPNDDKPYINIGKIYFSIQDTALAVNYLEKAFKINPNNKLTKRALENYNKK